MTIVSCGEMVMEALDAKTRLEKAGVGTVVLDAFSLKPFDKDTILRVAKDSELVVTVEEHGPYGGLHAQVCQILCANLPKTVLQISLPDEPVVSGKSKDVFCHYRMDGEGIAERILTAIYNG